MKNVLEKSLEEFAEWAKTQDAAGSSEPADSVPLPPPPMRTFRSGLFGEKETRESIKATRDWEVMIANWKPNAQVHRPDSGSDGWRAAAILVKNELDKAQDNRPRRRSKKLRKLAAYREGYYEGLLLAYCAHALGEFPDRNADEIRRLLNKGEK